MVALWWRPSPLLQQNHPHLGPFLFFSQWNEQVGWLDQTECWTKGTSVSNDAETFRPQQQAHGKSITSLCQFFVKCQYISLTEGINVLNISSWISFRYCFIAVLAWVGINAKCFITQLRPLKSALEIETNMKYYNTTFLTLPAFDVWPQDRCIPKTWSSTREKQTHLGDLTFSRWKN